MSRCCCCLLVVLCVGASRLRSVTQHESTLREIRNRLAELKTQADADLNDINKDINVMLSNKGEGESERGIERGRESARE